MSEALDLSLDLLDSPPRQAPSPSSSGSPSPSASPRSAMDIDPDEPRSPEMSEASSDLEDFMAGTPQRATDPRVYRRSISPPPRLPRHLAALESLSDSDDVEVVVRPRPQSPGRGPPPTPTAPRGPHALAALDEGLEPQRPNAGRLNCKNYAITIPQCRDLTPTEVGTRVLQDHDFCSKVERMVFVHEMADPDQPHPHLHGLFVMKKKVSTSFRDLNRILAVMDATGNPRQNNYQAVRSLRAYKAYLMKEQAPGKEPPFYAVLVQRTADGLYIGEPFDFDLWQQVTTQKKQTLDLVVQTVIDNDLIIDMPLIYATHGYSAQKHRDLLGDIVYNLRAAKIKNPADWVPLPMAVPENPEENRLYRIINTCVPELLKGRAMKLKHNAVVLYSPPDFHKTGLVKHLGNVRGLHVVTIDYANPTFPLNGTRPGDLIHVLVVDSWTGQVAPPLFEQILDLEPGKPFNIKGTHFCSTLRPLILINTNVHPNKWWPRLERQGADGRLQPDRALPAAIKARLNLVTLNRPLEGFENPEPNDIALEEDMIVRVEDE